MGFSRACGEHSLSEVECQDLYGEVQGGKGRGKAGKAQEHMGEDVLSQTD